MPIAIAGYMLRAHAYLLNENLDGSKRDLSAILRSDPEHKSAKSLHRQLKKYGKALDDAERLRGSRSWAMRPWNVTRRPSRRCRRSWRS